MSAGKHVGGGSFGVLTLRGVFMFLPRNTGQTLALEKKKFDLKCSPLATVYLWYMTGVR